MNMASVKRVLAEDMASEIAEAALVLPLAFMILLGIYWFGRAFNTYATINHAAREGARAAAAQTCATCGNGLNPANVATIINQAMQASSIDPNQIRAYTPTLNFCGGGGSCQTIGTNISLCTNVVVQNAPNGTTGLGAPACGVNVSFQYPYQFWLPFTSLNNQLFLLTADVQTNGEY
jgi:Flp pilus assembly protein TadG